MDDTCAEALCDCCGPCRCSRPEECEGNCAPLVCGDPATHDVLDGYNPPWPACAHHAAQHEKSVARSTLLSSP